MYLVSFPVINLLSVHSACCCSCTPPATFPTLVSFNFLLFGWGASTIIFFLFPEDVNLELFFDDSILLLPLSVRFSFSPCDESKPSCCKMIFYTSLHWCYSNKIDLNRHGVQARTTLIGRLRINSIYRDIQVHIYAHILLSHSSPWPNSSSLQRLQMMKTAMVPLVDLLFDHLTVFGCHLTFLLCLLVMKAFSFLVISC